MLMSVSCTPARLDVMLIASDTTLELTRVSAATARDVSSDSADIARVRSERTLCATLLSTPVARAVSVPSPVDTTSTLAPSDASTTEARDSSRATLPATLASTLPAREDSLRTERAS